jgi:hypothetical protein
MAILDGAIRCEDDRRSDILRAPSQPLNGIDFVEYRRAPLASPDKRHILDVTFLKPPPAALAPADFSVIGGVRIVGVQVTGLDPDASDPLRLFVYLDREGDFSYYALRLMHAGIDPQRGEARFSFKAGCPSPFDCRVPVICEPPALDEPALDYLAKDYQSFRRLMVDLIALRNPSWQERLPADLGMTLVELLAYAGDYLSYRQDSGPGTESYLDTCQHRISAARHARLVDYRMHNGRNAFTYVHLRAAAGTDGVVPAGCKLATRIGTALIGTPSPPGPVLPVTADFDADPALFDATVFETTALVRVFDRHNELRIHDWGDKECCLAVGATEAWLYALVGPAGAETVMAPELEAGDFLLLEEIRSPVTGAEADRNPAHRQVVRLTLAETTSDDIFTDAAPNGVLRPRTSAADPVMPLLHVVWENTDALAFPLCLSAVKIDGTPIDPVSLARGNVTPADHGRTMVADSADGAIALPDAGSGRWPLASLNLPAAPLTQQPMPPDPEYDAKGRLLFGRTDLTADPSAAMPAVDLLLRFPGGVEELWTPVEDLLDSTPYDQAFAAEIDNQGQAVLRFGDDEYGRRPTGVTGLRARWRVGNGAAGNLGAGALVHIVAPHPADPLDPANPGAPLVFADIAAVYQPLPARLGVDPQGIEQVRQLAPEAFRAIQFRAVTEADWENAALRNPDVAAAKARFRWTGSWHTVFVAVQPRDEGNLVRLPGGGATLAPAFAASIEAYLAPFLLAGYELAVQAAIYVPLEIDITLCVKRDYFGADIETAALRLLSNQAYADGTTGFFFPLNFGFGQSVYLSRLYAALETIDGLDSANVTVFKRYWEIPRDELARGLIAMGDMEIPRLDNDPNFPENGVLRLSVIGGR